MANMDNQTTALFLHISDLVLNIDCYFPRVDNIFKDLRRFWAERYQRKKMADEMRTKHQEVPFILDGQKIMKTVTKTTRCSDVINKLPNLSCPLAVFQSVDGVEKELSGKSKLLKVWRTYGPKRKVEFVIRKTTVHNKSWINASKLFSIRRKCEQPSDKSVQGKRLSEVTLDQVSDLAIFARYQRTKADALNKKSKGQSVTSDREKLMIQYSLSSLKLGFKEKYNTNRKVTRTTSTGTISSTDSGYQSSGSEDMNASETKTLSQHESGSSFLNRQTFMFSDDLSGPRHSTPIFTSRSQKRRESDIDRTFVGDCTVTSDKLRYLDEGQGKNIILQKFMNDQIVPPSKFLVATSSSTKRQQMNRYSMPVFSNQEDKCRFLWDLYCDSDSDSESETSEPCESLDIAFCIETSNQDTSLQARPRTIGRESEISNLNRFSLFVRDNGLDTCTEGSGFDYSFDCSFPRMDESQIKEFSFDFS